MNIILPIVQIIFSVTLITLIFLQSNGDTDGRSSNLFSTTATEKRGWEKVIFNLTIGILILFLISSVIQTIV